jgi:hypothetical protein
VQGLNPGVRFVHRDIGRVLEDIQPFPVVAADLGLPGADSLDYVLTNPGPDTRRFPGTAARHATLAIDVTRGERKVRWRNKRPGFPLRIDRAKNKTGGP